MRFSLLRTWWGRMEQAAKHVISEDDIPETCRQIMAEFPLAAVDLAIVAGSPLALMQLTSKGENHVVDKLIQAKALFDRLQEQPNAVASADHQVQYLKQELPKFTGFLDKHLLPAVDLHVEVLEGADFKSDLIKSDYLGPNQFKCLWKLLKAWKVTD